MLLGNAPSGRDASHARPTQQVTNLGMPEQQLIQDLYFEPMAETSEETPWYAGLLGGDDADDWTKFTSGANTPTASLFGIPARQRRRSARDRLREERPGRLRGLNMSPKLLQMLMG